MANGTIDLAVHSAKDMPSKLPGGFEIIAFTKREKPHDVLVTEKETPGLDQPITIGTSSTRRVALLKYFYPQVKCVPVRGNLQTRIKKLQSGQMDALMLAFAGIQRLGLSQKIRYHFPTDTFIPAVGQGSMAIEASGDLNPELKMRIRDAVNHGVTEKCLLAERSYLFTIQGGCSIPAFAHAHLSDNQLYMRAGIISLDGQRLVQFERHGTPDKASELGATLADQVLKEGGAEILADIKLQLNRNEDKV